MSQEVASCAIPGSISLEKKKCPWWQSTVHQILTVPRSSLNWTPSSLQETLTVTLPVSSVTLTPSSQLGGMGQPSDVHGVALSSLMYDHGLAQMVEGPTRFSSSSASQLDLIFIDNSDAVSDAWSCLPSLTTALPFYSFS